MVMDLAWGYWQVDMHPASRPKTVFFVPNGKKRWTRMPMGALNSHPTFCAMMEKLKREWNVGFEAKYESFRRTADGKVIVDDVMLFSEHLEECLMCLEEVLKVMRKCRVTVNLKKCHFFPKKAEFVGVDAMSEGDAPAESKFSGVKKLVERRPETTTDVLRIIGFFGFHQEWIPWHEV